MSVKNAPSGATGSACLSDLISIDRARLLEIIVMIDDNLGEVCGSEAMKRSLAIGRIMDAAVALRDQIALNDLPGGYINCGAAVKVGDLGYVTVNAPNLDLLETSAWAVRAAVKSIEADEPAGEGEDPWDVAARKIEELWPSVETADVHTQLRLNRLKLEIELEGYEFDHNQYDAHNDLIDIKIKQKQLELLAGLQKIAAAPALQSHHGAAETSPEALAALKLAARDASWRARR